jgi:hypothetical protein
MSAAGLVRDERPTDLGVVLLGTERPRERLQAVAPIRLTELRPFLRAFKTADGDPLTRSDLQSLLCGDDAEAVVPLLGSLGYARITPDGAVPDETVVERALAAVDAAPDSCPPATRLGALVDATTTLSTTAVARVVAEADAVDTDVSPEDVGSTTNLEALAATSPQTTGTERVVELLTAASDTAANQRRLLADSLATDGVEPAGDSVDDLVGHLRDRFDAVGLDPGAPAPWGPGGQTGDDPSGDADGGTTSTRPECNRVTATANLLRGIVDVADGVPPTLARGFVGVSAYDLFRVLSGSEVASVTTDTDGVVRFDSLDITPVGSDNSTTAAVRECLIDELAAADRRQTEFAATTPTVPLSVRDRIAAAVFEELPDGAVEPTTFAFTLPDPNELGSEAMAAYTGDHSPLVRERATLDDWHRRRQPADAARFTELTDRIVNRGLRRDLDHRVLRIMTPYDDDTFAEFASAFRSLLRSGFEIRLLTRHTRQRWQWERLRDNLLGELDENRDQVTVRTYSRYKEYGRVDFADGDDDRSEFGVHAKLQIVGGSEEGAALLGSANFMENSYHWNPECGAYTEQSRFVAAAIDFFDMVWELSAADEVALDRLQQVPDRSLYPSYYS